jgi:transposase-like protein
MTPDGAPGVSKAIEAMGPRSRRMRCGLHTLQHLPQQGPPPAWPACHALIAARRDAPTFEEGQRRQPARRAPYHDPLPEACRGLEDAAEASLNPLTGPARHRQDVRPSNLAARACEEERRRPTVFPQLWDEASGVTRVFAGLIRVSERWGKKQGSAFEQHHMRALRHPLHLEQPLVPMEEMTKDRSPRRSAASAQ